MHREDEDKDMVRAALQKSVKRVESITSKWSRNDPKVMSFVQMLVNSRMMKSSMDEVDAHIGKEQEEKCGENEVAPAIVIDITIQETVSSDFCNKKNSCQNPHRGYRFAGDGNFLTNLVR